MAKIDTLCRQASVYIIPRSQRRHGRQTHARQVLTKLARDHGPGHVLFVLRTIAESHGNTGELWSETIYAVSDIVLRRPDLADRGLAFLEAFDTIALGRLRIRAKTMGVGTARQVLGILLTIKVEEYFEARKPSANPPAPIHHPASIEAGAMP